MKIIDAHIHVFQSVDGANLNGFVKGCGLGRVDNAGEISAFIPPCAGETAFPVEAVLETLKQNGIEKAVLFQNPTIGSVNETVGQAIMQYPEIFAGVLQVDPFAEDALNTAETLAERYPFCAVKMELSTGWGWTGIHHAVEFSYSMLDSLAELAEQKGMAMVFDTGDTDSAAYVPGDLRSFASKHRGIPIVIEHGGYLTLGGDTAKWEAMTDIARLPNVYLGICAVPILLLDDYPCRESLKLIEKLYRKAGADKLIWGTDAPTTLKRYTYRQMLDYFLNGADFIPDSGKDKVIYENADRIYFK